MKNSLIFSESEIQKKVEELADKIKASYNSEEILAIGILKGTFVFYADLLKHLNPNVICDFYSVSYYGNSSKASQEATIDLDISQKIKDKNILLIDCIVDQGHTMEFVRKHIQQRNPKSIRTVALITKPEGSKNTKVDFSGFKVAQDVFVVGYGIDYQDQGRNLPYLAQVEELN